MANEIVKLSRNEGTNEAPQWDEFYPETLIEAVKMSSEEGAQNLSDYLSKLITMSDSTNNSETYKGSVSYSHTIELTESCPSNLAIYVSGENTKMNIWRTINDTTNYVSTGNVSFYNGFYVNTTTFCSTATPITIFSGDFDITFDIIFRNNLYKDGESFTVTTSEIYNTFNIGLFKYDTTTKNTAPIEGDGQIWFRGDNYHFATDNAINYVTIASGSGNFSWTKLGQANNMGGIASVNVVRKGTTLTFTVTVNYDTLIKEGKLFNKTVHLRRYLTPNFYATNYPLETAFNSVKAEYYVFTEYGIQLATNRINLGNKGFIDNTGKIGDYYGALAYTKRIEHIRGSGGVTITLNTKCGVHDSLIALQDNIKIRIVTNGISEEFNVTTSYDSSNGHYLTSISNTSGSFSLNNTNTTTASVSSASKTLSATITFTPVDSYTDFIQIEYVPGFTIISV